MLVKCIFRFCIFIFVCEWNTAKNYHRLGSVHWHPGDPQVASAPFENHQDDAVVLAGVKMLVVYFTWNTPNFLTFLPYDANDDIDAYMTMTMMKYLPSIGAPEEPQCLKPRRHSCNPTGHTFTALESNFLFSCSASFDGISIGDKKLKKKIPWW